MTGRSGGLCSVDRLQRRWFFCAQRQLLGCHI